jgi:peptidoglycan LD-endopeptidase LytH
MPKLMRRLIALAVAIVLLWFAAPWLAMGVFAIRLWTMPAPSLLGMPVQGVKPSGLRDTWHAARAPARKHEGIDIFAKKGTPVVSATDGIVTSVGENSLGGQVVWVLGPSGHLHYYAHLDQFADVARGKRVQAGTSLGTVGNTGNARTTPPHLHYGIYTATGAINPYPLLVPPRAAR